jgi:hypothetical protein
MGPQFPVMAHERTSMIVQRAKAAQAEISGNTVDGDVK